ncbi:MAG TPA: hypothetical protein PKY88_11565 [Anaerohalosphaeraceae bacterium]|nr:hypothetical protein [Anaerohalosphaeraceae bacterium]
MSTKTVPFRSGFNLLETILASSLLAGAVMTLGALSSRSVQTVRLDQETERAWELADMQLKLIDAYGVSAFQKLGQFAGQFSQDESYSWQAEIKELDIPYLYSVEIVVSWKSGSKVHSIRCQTRFCEPPDTQQTSPTTESQTTQSETSL